MPCWQELPDFDSVSKPFSSLIAKITNLSKIKRHIKMDFNFQKPKNRIQKAENTRQKQKKIKQRIVRVRE